MPSTARTETDASATITMAEPVKEIPKHMIHKADPAVLLEATRCTKGALTGRGKALLGSTSLPGQANSESRTGGADTPRAARFARQPFAPAAHILDCCV
jgi:hypothetical protein